MDTYGKITWENALYEARRYHAQKMSSRYNEGIDYDENGEIFDNFPEIIKDALNYLCEIGEIDWGGLTIWKYVINAKRRIAPIEI